MKISLRNVVLKTLPLFLILLLGCDKKEQPVEISAELQEIMDNGVTIDSITLDYAKIYTNNEGFFIIEPNPIENFVDKNAAVIYFKFISQSREDLFEYYLKKNDANLEQGFTEDWITLYCDKMKKISIEVKKNDSEFSEIDFNSSVVKFIETPEINSGYTFAKYELTINEFTNKFEDSFPDTFVLWFEDNDLKSNTYVFKISYTFNNNKEFVLQTGELKF